MTGNLYQRKPNISPVFVENMFLIEQRGENLYKACTLGYFGNKQSFMSYDVNPSKLEVFNLITTIFCI